MEQELQLLPKGLCTNQSQCLTQAGMPFGNFRDRDSTMYGLACRLQGALGHSQHQGPF